MEEVFKALADPSRRQLLDRLNARNGQTLRELCAELDMARQSVSKHLAVLEAANLVTTVKRGREKFHYLNAAPINAVAERWIKQYDRERVRALADLKRALEQEPMGNPEFVYTTYINTTPEQCWQALTEPAFTERYWGATGGDRLESRIVHDLDAGGRDDRRSRPDRARLRAVPPPLLHVAHVHAGVGRGVRLDR